jgi:hypothetical protein
VRDRETEAARLEFRVVDHRRINRGGRVVSTPRMEAGSCAADATAFFILYDKQKGEEKVMKLKLHGERNGDRGTFSYSTTKKENQIIHEATDIIAVCIRKVATENSCSTVNCWFELDRLDGLFAGTNSGNTDPDKALGKVQGLALDICEKLLDKSNIACSGEVIEQCLDEAVKEKLISRFGISAWTAVLL